MGEHPDGTSVTHATPDGIPARTGSPAPSPAARPAAAATGSTPPGRPADPTPPDPPPLPRWRGWSVGTRVVVRRRLAEGGWTDVLGDLLVVADDGVVVRTRRGDVRVPAADIALGKPVPPAPPRRAPRS